MMNIYVHALQIARQLVYSTVHRSKQRNQNQLIMQRIVTVC